LCLLMNTTIEYTVMCGQVFIFPFTMERKMNNSGFTMISNRLFDECMSEVSASAFKVICAVVRKTTGWNKDSDVISLSQMELITGLSRKTVISAISESVKLGWITQEKSGNSFLYKPGEKLSCGHSVEKEHQRNRKRSAKDTLQKVEKVNQKLVEGLHTQKDKVNTEKYNSVVPLIQKSRSLSGGLEQQTNKAILSKLGQDGLALWAEVYAKKTVLSWIAEGRVSINVLIYALALALEKDRNPAIVFNMVKTAPSKHIPDWSSAIELDTGLPVWRRFIWSAFKNDQSTAYDDSPVIY
jgi:phage replication O-like protein O